MTVVAPGAFFTRYEGLAAVNERPKADDEGARLDSVRFRLKSAGRDRAEQRVDGETVTFALWMA
jgi:hypothetical protein